MKMILDMLEQRIQKAVNFEQLRVVRDQIQIELHDRLLLSTTEEWVACVNTVHDRIIREAVVMSEAIMIKSGMDAASVPYAFILFGSGGRSEQTLWSDQDNGLIYEANESCSDTDIQYYEKLAKVIEDGLRVVGYPPCEGGVVASNSVWCKSDKAWALMLEEWFLD